MDTTPGKPKISVRMDLVLSTDEDKKHMCGFCKKVFAKPSHLKSHMISHTDRPFKCTICKRCFESEDFLKRHLPIHDIMCRYTCNICSETLTTKEAVTSHLKTHADFAAAKIKLKKKPECNRPVRRQLSEQTQATEKNFCGKRPRECSTVGKSSTSANNQTVKMYKCQFCEEVFVNDIGYMKHIISHRRTKLYRCPYCDRVTYDKAMNLLVHLRKCSYNVPAHPTTK